MRVAVLTISDSVARGERVDLSGPAIVQRCRELGWEVGDPQNCSDDTDQVRASLRKLADSSEFDLVLTTGGTGLGPRDNTPEATLEVGEKVIPGIAEEMRRKGAEQTPTAVLSRGAAVIRNRSIILNLPGSPKGAVESLDALAHLLPHAIRVLHGARHD
jgi:molybdenum cofactor synthesis domain-containing protein